MGSLTPLEDGAAIFGVFEAEQGAKDLDGDGSTDGHVAVWWAGPDHHEVIGPAYSIASLHDGGAVISFDWPSAGGSQRRWGTTIWHPDRATVEYDFATVNHTAIRGGGAYFRVSESPDYWSYETACDFGLDLNDDGDCEDFVLHFWTADEGLVNLGLADWWCPECDWGYVTLGTSAFVAVPSESAGDEIDGWSVVLHLVSDGAETELPVQPGSVTRDWAVVEGGVILAAGNGPTFTLVALDGETKDLGLVGTVAHPPSDGAILLGDELLADEDMNGDGDVTDDTLVAHLWRPATGLVNLGLTVGQVTDELEGMRPLRPVELLGEGRIVVLVDERHHGDLNGDGDQEDSVVHVVTIGEPPQVLLLGNRLGVTSFGDDYGSAAAALDRHLGPPTATLDTPERLVSSDSY